MGKIFYLMGKSAAGKDTLYKILRGDIPELKTVTMYTTRPRRENEVDGEEYHFVSESCWDEMRKSGRVIEYRVYQTEMGPWYYFTMDDGETDPDRYFYLMVGTLVSYEKIREYFGESAVYPLYIELEDSLRLERAVSREREQSHPDYRELCRRFLADDVDFSDENLERMGIIKRFENEDLKTCAEQLEQEIHRQMRPASPWYTESDGKCGESMLL